MVALASFTPPAASTSVGIALVGATTGRSYQPLLSFGEDTSQASVCDQGCLGSSSVPANEWLWLTVALKDSSGAPIRGDRVNVQACYDPNCDRITYTFGNSDGDGTATMIVPPSQIAERLIWLVIEPVGQSRVDAFLVVAGQVDRDPNETVIEPSDAWETIGALGSSPGYYYAMVDAAPRHSATSIVAAGAPTAVKGNMVSYNYSDDLGSGFGGGYVLSNGNSRFGISIGGPIVVDIGAPLPVGHEIPSDGVEAAISAWAVNRAVSFNATIARFGMSEPDGAQITLYSGKGGSWGIASANGGITNATYRTDGVGVAVEMTNVGGWLGGFKSSLIVNDSSSFVLAAATRGPLGSGVGKITLSNQSGSTDWSSSAGLVLLRQGDCHGVWSASLQASENVEAPAVAIVNMIGLRMPREFDNAFGIPASCAG